MPRAGEATTVSIFIALSTTSASPLLHLVARGDLRWTTTLPGMGAPTEPGSSVARSLRSDDVGGRVVAHPHLPRLTVELEVHDAVTGGVELADRRQHDDEGLAPLDVDGELLADPERGEEGARRQDRRRRRSDRGGSR